MGCQQTREGAKHQEQPEEIHEQVGKLGFSLAGLELSDKEPKAVTTQSKLISDYLLPVYGATENLYPLKEILAAAKKEEAFYDKDFPGTDASIYSYKNQLRKDIGACDWKKPWEYMDQGQKTIQVFEDAIEPNDIKQGNLSDCYFLSALSAIADVKPDLIRRLFVTQQYSGAGLYCMYLNIMGHWRQIVVDDRVPCFTDGGPIFSRCHGNELWVVLMEKSYAKAYYTYGNIESGYPGYAFRDLTGAPSDYLIPKNNTKHLTADEAWDFIQKGLKSNYILTAQSDKQIAGVEKENEHGIISEHCYAILEAQTVKDSKGVSDCIIKMRNPWGHKEWSGDWGDNSDRWTEELKVQLKVENKDDGIFWMSKVDFVTQFNSICVNKVHPEYLYTSFQLTHSQSIEPVTKRLAILRAYKNTHAFVSISLKDLRNFPRLDSKKYSMVRIVISKIDTKTNTVLSYVADKMEAERDVYVECNLNKGDYSVYVEVEWMKDASRELVLSCYSQEPTQIVELDPKDYLCDQILDQTLNVYKGKESDKLCKDYGDDIKRISSQVGGYLFFSYQNQSVATTLQETLFMTDLQSLRAQPPITNEAQVEINLRPKQNALYKYRVTAANGGAFSYKANAKYQLQQSLNDDMLIQLAKTKPDKTVQRRIKGEPIEVYFHMYNHQTGTAFLYLNKTAKTFNEDLTLKLKNLRIETPSDAPDPNVGIKYILSSRTTSGECSTWKGIPCFRENSRPVTANLIFNEYDIPFEVTPK